MNFRVGQKVVCVDADSPGSGGGMNWNSDDKLTNGTIYTIASVWVDTWGMPVVDLVERRRDLASRSYGNRVGYRCNRFRPAVERPTDISIFTKMLRDTRVPLKVDHQ